jgi:predicted secreted protein
MDGRDAHGTQFRRGDGAEPTEAFETIANVTSIKGPNRTRKSLETTSHSSADGWRTFIGGLKDGGEVSFDLRYDPAEPTHDLDEDLSDVEPRNYQLVLLPDTEDELTWDFAAVLLELGDEYPYDDLMNRSVKVKISGRPTLSATGS